MIDYKAIREAALALSPGLSPDDIEAVKSVATTMQAQTQAGPMQAPYNVTDKAIYRLLGVQDGAVLVGVAKALAEAKQLPPELAEWLADEGIDLADPQIRGALQALEGQSGITADMVATLLNAPLTDEPVWPGLKPGHVQTALRGWES